MRKILTLFFAALFSVSMWGSTSSTFYFAIESATLGANAVKFNAKTSNDGWSGEQTMTVVADKTYQGRLIYSLTYTFPHDGYYNWQFMNGTSLYVETYSGSWNSDLHDGEMYIYDTGKWIAYEDDPYLTIAADTTSGVHINEAVTITATANYGDATGYTFYVDEVQQQDGASATYSYTPTTTGAKAIKVVMTYAGGTKEATMNINVYEKWDIYVQNNCSWGAMKLYMFGNGENASWHGADCSAYAGLTGFYTVTLDSKYPKFIVNNGDKEQSFDNVLSKVNQPAGTTWQFVYDHEYESVKYYYLKRSYVVTFGIGDVKGTEGTVTTSPSITSGDYVAQETSMTFTRPAAKGGYKFKGWYSNTTGTGVALGTDETYVVEIGAAINVYAVYEVDSGTALDNTEVSTKAVKRMENGQLVIIKNGVKYNALGTEVK